MSDRTAATRSARPAIFGAALGVTLGALALTSVLASVPAAAQAAPAAAPQYGAVAAGIQPHRAIYKMSLASARNSSKVSDVRGRMMFEWADACDGWTTEQRFQLRFVYSEGDEMAMNTNYTTWESKNGQRYRFNVRKLINGEVDDDVRGEANLAPNDGNGSAQFTKPEPQEMDLPAATMFPTAHTLAILDHALKGEHFFTRTVFDGADAEGPTEVSTVIGQAGAPKDAAKSALLTDAKAWPVRMAFFPTHSDSAQPEYEMSLRLLRNGIAESMEIDYGDFTVNAILDTIEALPKSGC
ncbi:cell envelope integrity EipB family protein [Azospirillum doebereinerae]|uniref:cell envelope integrity EipB family protein n=1 Tax=Azospirillum doebereinerae TaxID=92933 RepID=UPI001EE5C623|nr:cell envelope integrity EipB family protein [Azospirillum doebereinerae]MCG5239787.1 cell envelope integrity EipB family protein [Azospirillum doebereinerae]